MKRFLLHPFSLLVGGVLFAFLGIRLFGAYTDYRERTRTDWKAKYDEAQHESDSLKKIGVRDSIRYHDVTIPRYVTVRQAAKANPTPENVKKVIQACDLIVSACDSIQGNLRGQIRSLEVENDLLRHKPGPPRLIAYGEPLYDAIGMRPVIRTGAEFRVIGPLYLKAEAEYAVPSTMREDKGDGLRILGGVRVNFNR